MDVDDIVLDDAQPNQQQNVTLESEIHANKEVINNYENGESDSFLSNVARLCLKLESQLLLPVSTI